MDLAKAAFSSEPQSRSDLRTPSGDCPGAAGESTKATSILGKAAVIDSCGAPIGSSSESIMIQSLVALTFASASRITWFGC